MNTVARAILATHIFGCLIWETTCCIYNCFNDLFSLLSSVYMYSIYVNIWVCVCVWHNRSDLKHLNPPKRRSVWMRNIQHLNQQSHVTGPKNSSVVVNGVFDLSLKISKFICGKVATSHQSVPMFLPVMGHVCPQQQESGSTTVGPTVHSDNVMWF